MARLPYDPVPTVTPSGPSPQTLRVDASPAAFGGLIAQGEQRFGAGAEQAGSNLMDTALRVQAMNNEADARAASNKFIADAGQAWAQYGTLEGKQAVDAYPKFVDTLNTLQQQHANSLVSPQARNDFLNASSYMLNRMTLMSSTHAAEQQRAYWKQSHVSNIENMTQTGVLMQNDPQTVDTAANSVVASVERLGEMNGWDPERTKAETSQAVGKYYRTVIESQAANDPMAAQATFDRVKGKMDGVSIAQTERMLRPARDTAAVAGAVDAITTGQPISNVAPITRAIVGQEASGPTAVSPAGARGTRQIIQGTFNQYAKPGESFDNEADRVTVSDRAISDYTQRYNGDPARVAVAYFSGPGNVAPPGAPTPWIEDKSDGHTTTSQYVKGVLGRMGQQPAQQQSTPRDNAIPNRYFDEIQMIQRAYTETQDMRPELRERVINGVFSHISRMNALENQAEDRASRDLHNQQRDTESLLLGHAVSGDLNMNEQDLGNLLMTQRISPAGYNAIKAVQEKQAEGRDEPVATSGLWSRIMDGTATPQNVYGSLEQGAISGKTAVAMTKTIAERQAQHQKAQDSAVEKGAFDTLRAALNGKAIESGLLDVFGEGRKDAAQLWAQAQGEWNDRVIFKHEDPQAVLGDMLPRYQKSLPDNPKGWPNPRFGPVQSLQDVAAVAQKTREAHEAGQITDGVYNSEGQLLNKYQQFYQLKAERDAAAKAGATPNRRVPNLPMAPTDEGSR